MEDVAMAHIMVFENPSASGRHMCVQSICHWSDFAVKVAELYPNYKVPKYAKPHIVFSFHQENPLKFSCRS